jgi:hypothetical protein
MRLPRRTALTLPAALALPARASEPSASQAFPDLPIPVRADQAGWEAEIRRVLDAAPPGDAAAVREVRGLLDAPRGLLGLPERYAGAWRVRSLQANARGVYVYRWFTLSMVQEGAALRLHKDTGSQRMFGVLYRDLDERLVFLGASYIPPQRPAHHSALHDNPAQADRSRDVRGAMVPIGPRRMLLIFEPGRHGVELYELAR